MRMCDLAKGLFGKMGGVRRPLFLCIEGFGLLFLGDVTYIRVMDAECELV